MNDTNPVENVKPSHHSSSRHVFAMYPTTRQESFQKPGVGDKLPETVINIDSGTVKRLKSPRVHIIENRTKSIPHEKFVIAVTAGLSSLVPIILTYVTLLRPHDLFDRPVVPLVAGAVVVLASILTISFVCTLGTHTTSLSSLFPLTFAVIGGLMIVVFFGVVQSNSNLEFVDMNYKSVLITAGMFGAIALGSSVEYLV